jgi:hypothetical protein
VAEMKLRADYRRHDGERLAADVVGDGGQKKCPDNPPAQTAGRAGARQGVRRFRNSALIHSGGPPNTDDLLGNTGGLVGAGIRISSQFRIAIESLYPGNIRCPRHKGDGTSQMGSLFIALRWGHIKFDSSKCQGNFRNSGKFSLRTE